MFCTLRTHSDAVTEKFLRRTNEICEGIATMQGGKAQVTIDKHMPYVLNDKTVTEKLEETAEKLLGRENIQTRVRGMGGEDFSFMSRVKPCTQFDLGSKMTDPDRVHPVHGPKFQLNEDCLAVGVKLFLQFVLDNMNGIEFPANA